MYEDVTAVAKVFSVGRGGARVVGGMVGRIQGVDKFGTIEELAGRSGRIEADQICGLLFDEAWGLKGTLFDDFAARVKKGL